MMGNKMHRIYGTMWADVKIIKSEHDNALNQKSTEDSLSEKSHKFPAFFHGDIMWHKTHHEDFINIQ